jgi:hypothetical protein
VKRVQRKRCALKIDEEMGRCRKLHNEEVHDLYSSSSVIRIIKSRRMLWVEGVARMEKRNVYRLLVGKQKRKRPLGRSRRSSVNNIKMDVVETEWFNVDWIGLVQDRQKWRALVNAIMNFRIP